MARKLTCVDCGEPTDKSYRMCLPCLRLLNDRDCAAQGVPRKITDPADLEVFRPLFEKRVAS